MKKLVAVMLTACLTFQTWMGAVVPVSGAGDVPAVMEEAEPSGTPVTDSGGAEGSEEVQAPDANDSGGGDQASDVEVQDGGDVSDGDVPDGDPQDSDSDGGVTDGSAEDSNEANGENDEEVVPDDANDPSDEESKDDTEPKITEDSVDLDNALTVRLLSFHQDMHADVSVTDANGTPLKSSQSMDPTSTETSKEVQFNNLPEGVCIVSIKSKKFATYTQKVTIKKKSIAKIEVCTVKTTPSSKDEATAEKQRYGWMCIGDVTGDGVIKLNKDFPSSSKDSDQDPMKDPETGSDEYALLAAIRKNSTESNFNVYSGNDDKVEVSSDEAAEDDEDAEVENKLIQTIPRVDILDLQCMVESYYAIKNTAEPRTSSIRYDTIPEAVTYAENTKIEEGSIANLFNDNEEETVSLGRSDGNDISEEAPVEVTFEIPKSETSDGTMGGITIQAPKPTEVEQEDGSVVTEDAAYPTAGEISLTLDDETTRTFSFGNTESASSQGVSESVTPIAAAIQNLANLFITKVIAASPEDPQSVVEIKEDGSIVVNFGEQIAVKTVTIKITGTKKNSPLAEIAKVEFVNDMDSRIPEPELDKPEFQNEETKVDNQEFTVTWTQEQNITGYELEVSGEVKDKKDVQTQTISVAKNSHTVSMINDGSLLNFKKYKCKVRSVNGNWRSDWSDEIEVIPHPNSLPGKVDNVKLTGLSRSIKVEWKNMKDSSHYMVYYKKHDKDEKDEYHAAVKDFVKTENSNPLTPEEEKDPDIGSITGTSYTITGLEVGTEYDVYVEGWNTVGWSTESPIVKTERTLSDDLPELPNYYLWNKSEEPGKPADNIQLALRGNHGDKRSDGLPNTRMVASERDNNSEPYNDENKNAYTAWGVVDNDYTSYWSKVDWDDGVSYANPDHKGLEITFTKPLETNYFTFTDADPNNALGSIKVWYSEKDGVFGKGDDLKEVGAILHAKQDKNGKKYYVARLSETINAKRIHFCLQRSGSAEMKVGEIHFHENDGIQDAIWALYKYRDQNVLKDNVNLATIEKIEKDLEEQEEQQGEKHPLHDELLLATKTAKAILEGKFTESQEVINTITASKDGHLGFGGLNPWQPLGKVARMNEKISVFVGHNTKNPGENAQLQLIFTQYHAESNSLAGSRSLKVGENIIDIGKLQQDQTTEQGGQLYIAYTGNSANDHYYVNVIGGNDIPVLNLYRLTEDQRTKAITEYLDKLQKHVEGLEIMHNEKHKNDLPDKLEYNETTCFLNSTDIMMESMMYSVPATQVLSGIKANTSGETNVQKLNNSLKAMEDAMHLFYQHKGLLSEEMQSAASNRGNNTLPSQHLNIRYMTMFTGAFMYASGNHIGIEYPQTAMVGSASEIGSFGWGIGHEIGHDINQGSYAIAEVTNNYFAQLMTKNDNKNESTRWGDYAKVYEKVTSGAVGRSSNVGTQLALYWQLHLAFDNATDDKKTYNSADEIFNNLFFARVDTYSRNPSKAPLEPTNEAEKETKPPLTLDGGVDQNIMRLACAAANGGKGENILPFFERWGMVPDEKTKAYAAKFGAPTKKALYYVNDEARNFRDGKSIYDTGVDGTINDETEVVDTSQTTVKSNGSKKNIVEISIKPKSTYANKNILGYEIRRYMYSDGSKPEPQVIGFQLADDEGAAVYEDTIYSINNRVMYYTVRPVDQYLNYGAEQEIGSEKIETNGILEKYEWSVESENLTAEADKEIIKTDEDNPDAGYDDAKKQPNKTPSNVHSIDRIIDNDEKVKVSDDSDDYQPTYYEGQIEGGEAKITIDMGKVQEVTSLIYDGDALSDVTVEVSKDKFDWTTVKENVECKKNADGKPSIWFDSIDEEGKPRENWIGTYDARYVRMTIKDSGTIKIQEIDICGPSGDNVEFVGTDGNITIGYLDKDYVYEKKTGKKIPEGSLIFVGSYRGNPAYNVVTLFDVTGDVIGSNGKDVVSGQVILADVPKDGDLGNTSDGRWVYYVSNSDDDQTRVEDAIKTIRENGGKIRGELYRVDDALTLKNERIVSDTKIVDFPKGDLPKISLTDSNQEKQ